MKKIIFFFVCLFYHFHFFAEDTKISPDTLKAKNLVKKAIVFIKLMVKKNF